MKKRSIWLAAYPLTILAVMVCIRWGSRTVTALAENSSVERSACIILDAGHGGVDGGATSCSGILESRYNLEIALRLEALFHLLGYETKMIRREDISVYTKGETIAQKKVSDLKERLRIATETPDALYLSIHQNYFSDRRYSGAQVFYPKTDGSQELARQLQTALCTALDPDNHRQAKKSSGVYLMDRLPCTGVLIECGFLSNPQEDARLRDGTYQKKLCAVIATSVGSFLSNT